MNRFFNEAQFENLSSLPDTLDGGVYRFIPESCEKHQLIIQSPRNEKYFYLVNERFWNMMSPVQQGAAIVHEALYRISLDFGGPESSEALRYVVSLLLANRFDQMSKNEGLTVLNRAHIWLAPDTPFPIW